MKELIDKWAAIDLINARLSQPCKNHTSEFVQGMEDGYCRIRSDIKCLPSAQPEPQWILISERLPENNDSVIVTWVNHNPEVYYKDITDKPFTATAHYHNGRWYWYSTVTKDYLDEYGTWEPDLVDEDIEIIAWMPMPEPPKMEGEQE